MNMQKEQGKHDCIRDLLHNRRDSVESMISLVDDQFDHDEPLNDYQSGYYSKLVKEGII